VSAEEGRASSRVRHAKAEWSLAEDALLTGLMKQKPRPSWARVASKMPHGRTAHGVRNRWVRLCMLGEDA